MREQDESVEISASLLCRALSAVMQAAPRAQVKQLAPIKLTMIARATVSRYWELGVSARVTLAR